MKGFLKFIILIAIVFFSSTCTNKKSASDRISDETKIKEEDYSSSIEALLSKMTLEDKVGEMTQLSLDMLLVGEPYNVKNPYEFDKDKLQNVLVDLKVGSILNNGGHANTQEEWHQMMEVIQEYATNKKATGIPVLYGIDAIHGANYTQGATLYPQQINLANTWNTELVKDLAEISAYETRASAIPWAFAPVLDVGRDPRWSRFWETFGEDVLLVKKMGEATFQGLQGDNISNKYKVAACMKHFLGYSVSHSGKDRTPSYIPEIQLRELILPPFEAAIASGARTVMINSGEINGIPVHANPKILKDLLRDELGFTGLAVTDWEDIKYLVDRHHVAKDYKDAVRIAINAGIDMSMVPIDLKFSQYLVELVNERLVPMSRIDEAVKRILRVKYELGLFDNSFYPISEYPDFGSEKFANKALLGALESIVMLKNKSDILPLQRSAKVLVTGPTSNSLAAINGAWTGTWQGKDEKYDTPNKMNIYQALQNEFGNKFIHVEGTSIEEDINTAKAVAVARKSDVAIICIGEMPYVEIPGNINDLSLPQAQIDLVKEISKTGTPIVLVLVEGRPRIIREIEPLVDAVLFLGLPGNEGGRALVDILSGDYNPSGHLSFTYPRYVNDLINYDYKGTEVKAADFSDNAINPQWTFGHGLSYTFFNYSNLNVTEIENGKWTIDITIENTGNKNGADVIQMYVRDKVASITPSNKRLRGFKKINLKAGEKKAVTLQLSHTDLEFVGIDNKWVTEPGDFEITIANQKATITLR